MFRLPTLKIGRLFGIPLELNLSWFLVFGIVGWTWSVDVYPGVFPGRPVWVDVGSGLVTTLLFFGSIVTHELSHSLVARRQGIPVERVTLFMFGGVAQLSEEPRTAGAEALMSLAGPGMSLGLAVLCYGAYRAVVAVGASASLLSPLLMLAGVNLAVAVFNMAPGYPMDGGRVLHALLWWATGDRRRATRLASGVGQGLGLALAGVGVWVLVTGSLEGLWLALLGLFLRALASAAYRSQAARLDLMVTPVSQVMATPAPVFRPGDPLHDVVRVLGGRTDGRLAALVDADGWVRGAVTLRGALGSLAGGGDSLTAADAAEPVAPSVLVDAGESLESVARRLEGGERDGLLVAVGGRLVGVVDAARVGARMVEIASERPARVLPWWVPRT